MNPRSPNKITGANAGGGARSESWTRWADPIAQFWRSASIIHPTFVTFGLWLSLVSSAHGMGVEIPITPTNFDQYKYRFLISTNAATKGVAFPVTITAKKEDIHADSASSLSIVTHTQAGGGSMHSIAGVKPEIPITMKKSERVWQADFTVSKELLENPGFCFVFTEIAHATIEGKSVAMPSADFYEIKLHDFLKQ
jgi:hypothetical protein